MALPNGDLITTVFDPQMAYPVDKRMQVDTLNSRDSISMFIRWEGMTVYVLEDSKIYILQGGRSNEYWKELGTGTGTGGTTFVGQFASADLLPTSGRSAGDYAFVGTGDDFVQYNWDNIANEWVMAEGQTDMASEFFHIGYKTPLRRPVIFPLFSKDVLVEESGDFVFSPETGVARFIFTGEVTAIRGIETAAADREIKLVNRTGSDIPLRDKASGIPSGSGFDFGGSDYTWVNGSEITLKGNGTYWELAPNNQIAFSDHLDSVNAQVSVGSDGLEVISNVFDKNLKREISLQETDTYIDGTSMNDSKADGFLYFKVNSKYFVNSDFLNSRVIDVRQFGAVGDKVTDDTYAISQAFSVAGDMATVENRPITVLFPPSDGYRTTDKLTLLGRVSLLMMASVVYDGPQDRIALEIGETDKPLFKKSYIIDVVSNTDSDWNNPNYIGVKMFNQRYCNIVINQVQGFTIGAQLIGDNDGWVYNIVNLQAIRRNQIGLELTTANGGWCNENVFIGGSFSGVSNLNTSKNRWGIKITSTESYYSNANKFIKPSFELQQPFLTGGAQGIPVLVEYGQMNRFEDCRCEGTSLIAIQTDNNSRSNYMSVMYGNQTLVKNDVGVSPSTILDIQNLSSLYRNFHSIYKCENILSKVNAYNATEIYAQEELAFISGTSPVEKVNSITIEEKGLLIPTTRGLVVAIDTSKAKRFSVKVNLYGNGGRIKVKCFNSAGGVLTGSSPLYLKSEAVNFSPISQFGNVYVLGNDFTESSTGTYLAFHDDVAYAHIIFSGTTAAMRLVGFDIQSCEGFATIIPFKSKKGKFAESPQPGNYSVGDIIYNNVNSSPPAWRWNGSTWVDWFELPDMTYVLRSNRYIARNVAAYDLESPSEGLLIYNTNSISNYANAPYDGFWFIEEIKGSSHDIRLFRAFDRVNSRMFIRAYNPDGWTTWREVTTPDSTTTQRGIIEIATNAEIQTGTDEERAVTPKGIKENYLSFAERNITSTGTVAITPLTYNVKEEVITFTGSGTVNLNGFNAGVEDGVKTFVNKTGNNLTCVDGAAVSVPFSEEFVIPNNQSARFRVSSNLLLKEL